MATFHEALKHKNRLSPVLLKRAEVVAVGVGYADPGKPALGAGVIVYTQKKIVPSSLTSLKGVLAKSGAGIPIRFVPSGGFKLHDAAPNAKAVRPKLFSSRVRPVPGGVSVGKVDPSATGSGGLIVTRDNQLYLLSNNHVLVKNNSNAFAAVVQPGPSDSGTAARDTIGRLFRFVKLNPSGTNYVDAALALPSSNRVLNPRYLLRSSGQLVTVPGHLASYPVGLQLVKGGRTTGFVRGTVESNNADVRVTYGGSLGVLTFRNQSIIRGNDGAVSLPGDSGSVWLRASDRFAAALNFAGTGDGMRSIGNPIGYVMSAFGVRTAVPLAGGKFRAGTVTGFAPPGNPSYVRALTKAERDSIRVETAKSKP
ncbi:hypothetical protein ACFPES_16710 [Paenibacillus sp. GCM10023248]|uniref:hypothetical protein n=1 Tax=unclassified Paenibacillus TaxID=185978 RepID=UPI002378A94C|nr:hypothetical protein [Paenibacillus sp. MAHUQ-63]MDD9268682.1 hypothetical protein [Paenibacillus sp. MAHUQ-63]